MGVISLVDKFKEVFDKYCTTSTVKAVLLGDVCQCINGISYRAFQVAEEPTEDTIGVLTTRNLLTQDGTIDFSDVKYISKTVSVKEERFIKKNDILICKEGNLNGIGKVAYAYEDMPFVVGLTLGLLRVNTDLIDSLYLYYVLTSEQFRTYISNSAINNTVRRMPRLNFDVIKTFEFPLPSLMEQHEIVYELELYKRRLREEKDITEARSKLSVTEFLESRTDIPSEKMERKQMNPLKPYNGEGKYIFISYAHKDSEDIFPIIRYLQDEGINIWYDDAIEAGSEWPEYIAQRIINSDRMICFISDNYKESQNCKRELNFAVAEKKEILSVFLHDNIDLTPGMRMQLGSYQSMFCDRYEDKSQFCKCISEENFVRACH